LSVRRLFAALGRAAAPHAGRAVLAAVVLSDRRGSPLSVRRLFGALGRAAAPHAGCAVLEAVALSDRRQTVVSRLMDEPRGTAPVDVDVGGRAPENAGAMRRLEGRTAIVTGAAHGIGRAISECFADEGARVTLVDIDGEAGEDAAAAIRARGGEARFCHADVSSPADVARAVAMAAADSGCVHVLCNSAAYLGESRAALESTPDEWDACIRVAMLGTHHVTREVLPFMIARKQGSIVNIVSIQAMVGCPTSAAYTTTKAGLLGYTLSVAYDYGPHNVRVNALCPGPIQTRISPKPGEPHYEWQCAQTVLGRVGTVREVATVALFLASDDASYVTGAVIPVDGGWTSK
jgi:NAD(P)-dependent dehydrogenase (short-subunit alcohol dehydrogenase family)